MSADTLREQLRAIATEAMMDSVAAVHSSFTRYWREVA
jgi:hypothetical protein